LELAEFTVEAARRVAAAACPVLEAVRLVRSRLGGRWLDEVVSRDEAAVSMLLGGLEPSFRGDPYGQRSLARFYRDVVGVSVTHPRLVTLRLDDGLDLASAARGVKVRGFESRFSKLLAQLCKLASDVAGGRVEAGGIEGALEDPNWLPQRVAELLNTLARIVPPYSSEAPAILAVAQGLPYQLAEAMPYRGVLEELGVKVVEAAGAKVYVAGKNGKAARYACLVYTVWKLFQLREITQLYNPPDPLAQHVENAWARMTGGAQLLLEQLSLTASTLQCMEPPIPHCKTEPPCLPQGYRLVRLKTKTHDTTLGLPSAEATLETIVEAMAPLLVRGLAWTKPLGNGELEIAFTYTLYPPQKTAHRGQTGETLKSSQQSHTPTRVGPPGSPNPSLEVQK